ncbi:MAG: PqqD family protein [Anaerolineae bacterium]
MLSSCRLEIIKVNSLLKRPIHTPDVASRVYGADAVIISPHQGMVRMLNPTATRIWQLADGSRSVDEIVVALVEEYEVDSCQAEQAVAALLSELVDKGLILWLDS